MIYLVAFFLFLQLIMTAALLVTLLSIYQSLPLANEQVKTPAVGGQVADKVKPRMPKPEKEDTVGYT